MDTNQYLPFSFKYIDTYVFNWCVSLQNQETSYIAMLVFLIMVS